MLFTITNEHVEVTVNSLGAELWSVLGSDGTEYLWQADPAFWEDRSPNLFPFVGRLTRGCYSMDEKVYEMKIHGFAAAHEFTLTEQTDRCLVFELRENQQTLQQYPRQFAFRVSYELTDSTLQISYQVENRDEKILYFGLGGHPGFRVPLEAGKCFEDYRLRFAHPSDIKRIGFTEACFLNGQDAPFDLQDGIVLPLRHDLFDQDAIVWKDMCRQVTLEADSGHGVTVSYPQMPYLGIWHRPKTQAPYVCIEPWATLPATQDEITVFEDSLMSLEPGKTYENSWSITIF